MKLGICVPHYGCGVSDGSACAIVTTPAIARSLGKTDLVAVKALQIAVSNGQELSYATIERGEVVA